MQPPLSAGPPPAPYRPEPASSYRVPTVPRSSLETLGAILGVVIGVMIFIGFLALQAVYLVPAPCTSYSCPTVTADQAAYSNLLHILGWIAIVALDLAVGLSVTIAFLLGMRSDVPESTRRSAFYFATVFLGVYTVFGSLLVSSIFSFIRYM